MRALLALLMLLFVPSVYGAVIQGTVYDFQLKPAENAVVEINTVPKQIVVATDAKYSLSVPAGTYIIEARIMLQKEVVAQVEENITVAQEGTYNLDLITFPLVEDYHLEGDEPEIDTSLLQENGAYFYWILGFAVLIVAGVIVYFRLRKQAPVSQVPASKATELYPDLEKVLEFIKKEGTTTQLAIRQQFPLSEAKISLMLTDLEAKGLIKKVKKGRGNVITLP